MTSNTLLPASWFGLLRPGFLRAGLLLGIMAFLVFACTLVGNDKPEQTFSFTKSYDTLAQFDSVHILLKDTSGRTVDNLFRGKVDDFHKIENLKAEHWKGGIAVLSILGYDDGELVYRVDKRFNGDNDQVLDTVRLILPGMSLSAGSLNVQLTEGDSIPFPSLTTLTVSPAELSDKTLLFTSSAPQLLQVGPTYVRALQRGTLHITAALAANPSKSITLNVTILPNPLTPETLLLSPDTVRLAAGGASAALTVKVIPTSADLGVIWTVKDASIAQVSASGTVQGLKEGSTLILAASTRRPALVDTILVLVSAPVAVSQVRFQKESVELFVGGAAESLLVAVEPALANPAVTFSVQNPTIASVSAGRLTGLAEGQTSVIARSTENSALADTLSVTVFPAQHIDSVRVAPDSIQLYTGAPGATLSAKVYPLASLPVVVWQSRNVAIATVDGAGKVSPVGPGKTLVVTLSRADSTQKDSTLVFVKRDMPQVVVGRDTVVPLGSTLAFRPQVTQDYGSVVQFRWDLNGDGAWDGTSDSIQTVSAPFTEAKDVAVAFYVKDSEGNDTTVYRKVKVVVGRAVQILSPMDSSYTNQFSIAVSWSVNGKEQDSLKTQVLKVGVNTITREAKDEGGNVYAASVTVFVDTTPPNKPVVQGPAVTASRRPIWTWTSGGGGGAGTYKYGLDEESFAKAKDIQDTTYTPAQDLTEGTHTLFVWERDRAGNWSAAGRVSLQIDLTLPGTPLVAVSPSGPTNVRRPNWSWATGGNGGSGQYQYKLDNATLTSGATQTTDTTFTPAANLATGPHTLYVQEKDSAGNWSASGSASVFIDTIAPNAPTVTAATASPTNNAQPTWTWTSGGGGGKGYYRYKVGDTLWASGAAQGTGTTFTPATALVEGVWTLYVAEQDSAGNWSVAGSKVIRIDLTPPGSPSVTSAATRTISLRPTWNWISAGNGGAGYRYKLDDNDFTKNPTSASGTTFTPTSNLDEGLHILYVQEKDSAENWSGVGSFGVTIHGQTGFAVSGYYLLKTSNGGSSWASISTAPSINMNAVHFSSPDRGVVVGDGGKIAYSTNGGIAWTPVSTGLDNNFNLKTVHFLNSNLGFAGGNGGMVKTTNGGQTWTRKDAGIDYPILSVFVTGDQTAYAVGGGGDGGFQIFQTKNGGDLWTSPGNTITGGFKGSVWFTSTNTGYIVDEFGLVRKTTNAGSKWDTLYTGYPEYSVQLSAIQFPSVDTGYICGGNGLVLRTYDAGKNWKPLNTNSTQSLNSVFFTSGLTGIVVGASGTMLKTNDGGDNWTSVSPQIISGEEITSVYFP